MILGIVGTRHEVDRSEVMGILAKELQKLGGVDLIVSGGQVGVDTLAREFAQCVRIPFREYPESAEEGLFFWQRCRARNRRIANASDSLIAFPCKHSKGTWMTTHMFTSKPNSPIVSIHKIACSEGR